MKMKLMIICLITILTLTACSGGNGYSNDEIQIKTLSEQEPVSGEMIGRDNLNKERIGGEISRVVGNVITLELFELPERIGEGTGAREDSEVSSTSPLTGTTTTGVPGQGRGQGNKMSSFEKTGVTVELIVPVGTEIRSQANPEIDFDIENLSKGMNIMVFVDSELTDDDPESDTVYAFSINIIQSR